MLCVIECLVFHVKGNMKVYVRAGIKNILEKLEEQNVSYLYGRG